jgi:truncated hemoglobin YjbI
MHHFMAHINGRAESIQSLIDNFYGAVNAGTEAARVC